MIHLSFSQPINLNRHYNDGCPMTGLFRSSCPTNKSRFQFLMVCVYAQNHTVESFKSPSQ